ncbi:hypothetical protein ACROYT_G043950 [Oculina patagonica]
MLSASSSNCSVQNKKIRNKKYYEDNKENLKNSKVRFQLNLEVKKEKGDWLNAIKTKIAFVKDQLHLSTRNTRAANAHLMETLLDNWLKNNHIPLEKNTSDEFVDQLHPSKAVPLPPEEIKELFEPRLNFFAKFKVYEGSRYREAVEMMVEYSLAEEIEDVKQDVAYDDGGTGVMVDGRHDPARTAYHTTVTAISKGHNSPKGNYRHCHQESRCKTQGDYVHTKRIIKNPEAAEALLKAIKGTSVYKYAEDFAKVFISLRHLCVQWRKKMADDDSQEMKALCDTCHKGDRDTYYIESFHNCLLIYVPKRIHFGDKVYNMRVYLACLDWNGILHLNSMLIRDREGHFEVVGLKSWLRQASIMGHFFALYHVNIHSGAPAEHP